MKFVLASESPRRKELLAMLGISFESVAADIDEESFHAESIEDTVQLIACGKARAIAETCVADTVVIAADTVVDCDGRVFLKPKNEADAFFMLSELQGREHFVHTALCVMIHTAEGERIEECVLSTSRVYVKAMTEADITAYIKTGEPMDKAGAYAIQGLASVFVEGICGDYYSIMGLPVSALHTVLRKHGLA